MDFPALTTTQLGDILRGFRSRRQLTQAQLARLVGTDQASISRIEAGKGQITVARLYQLLSALDLELVVREKSRPDRAPTPETW